MDYRRNPIHKDVKVLRKLYKRIILKYFGNINPDELPEKIKEKVEEDRDALADFSDEVEELMYAGTIMLSTGMSPEEIENLNEEEFWYHYNNSRRALGGTCEDFLSRYIDTTKRNGSGTSNGLCEEKNHQKKSRK
jgi:hypothetical protein